MEFNTDNEEDYVQIQLHMKDLYLLYKSVKVHLEKWPGGDYEEQIYLQRMSNKKSRLIFTSGGKEPVVDGGGGNHSIFAKSLIDILNDLEIENTISDISKKITSFVITNSDQTPEYSPLPKSGHDGGEFIFVPKS